MLVSQFLSHFQNFFYQNFFFVRIFVFSCLILNFFFCFLEFFFYLNVILIKKMHLSIESNYFFVAMIVKFHFDFFLLFFYKFLIFLKSCFQNSMLFLTY